MNILIGGKIIKKLKLTKDILIFSSQIFKSLSESRHTLSTICVDTGVHTIIHILHIKIIFRPTVYIIRKKLI